MYKKLFFLIFIVFVRQAIHAQDQNAFITVWKPNIANLTPDSTVTPQVSAGTDQIWFPGIGENYTIMWEEINYPQHNGVMTNVTSTQNVLIDFGTSLNPVPADAAYRVKVFNGNGTFRQIRFADFQALPSPGGTLLLWDVYGSADQLIEIAQWGNIAWTSMNCAFALCRRMQLTATDVPDLSSVTDASKMFFNVHGFTGAPSMLNWDTSSIKDFSWMFAHVNDFEGADQFNFPLGSWDTSSAEDFSWMFADRKYFNQNLNDWDTSQVKDMKWMFSGCLSYNQPLDNWDMSQVTDISFMFHFIPVFNQNINGWDTSNVTNMSHIFHGCTAFNQPLDHWDTSKVTNMDIMFSDASSFNQSLETWNLSTLTSAFNMLMFSGLDCNRYSKTLWGWANNPNTANNINLSVLTPLQYSVDAVNSRNTLLSKGWNLTGDSMGGCRVILATSDHSFAHDTPSIYPNPADKVIYLHNIDDITSYKVIDASGRIIRQSTAKTGNSIDIIGLTKGNYILQVITKEKPYNFKFIKK